jgi:hypothetical protein
VRRDQLVELACAHRHRRPPPDAAARRDAFHTSPQLLHRQYAFSSGFRALVVIDRDPHAGHAVGVGTTGDAPPLLKLDDLIGFSIAIGLAAARTVVVEQEKALPKQMEVR